MYFMRQILRPRELIYLRFFRAGFTGSMVSVKSLPLRPERASVV